MGDPGGTRAVSRHGGCHGTAGVPRAAEGTLNGRISHRLTSLTPPIVRALSAALPTTARAAVPSQPAAPGIRVRAAGPG